MFLEYNLFGLQNTVPTLLILVKYSPLITSIANICLLVGMLYVYLERYLKVKSKFTTTLVLFSLLFLIQNILFSMYFILNPPETPINAVLPLVFLGLEFTALSSAFNDNKRIIIDIFFLPIFYRLIYQIEGFKFVFTFNYTIWISLIWNEFGGKREEKLRKFWKNYF